MTPAEALDLKWPKMVINHGHYMNRRHFTKEQLNDPSVGKDGILSIEAKLIAADRAAVDAAKEECGLWIRISFPDWTQAMAFDFASPAKVTYDAYLIGILSDTPNLHPTSDGRIHGPNLADYFNRQLARHGAYISQIGYPRIQRVNLPQFWNKAGAVKCTIQCWDLPPPPAFNKEMP